MAHKLNWQTIWRYFLPKKGEDTMSKHNKQHNCNKQKNTQNTEVLQDNTCTCQNKVNPNGNCKEDMDNKEQKCNNTDNTTCETNKHNKHCQEKKAEFERKIEELQNSIKKEKDDYLRLMAEFENFRRRTSEEKLSLVSSASADTIKGLLPVLDDCESAMQILEKSSDEAAKEGTMLIYNKLMEYLKTKGLEKIEAKNAKFDTDFHEAIAQMPAPSEDKKGYVFDVIKTGYLLNGKVLRYAKVVVGV